LKGPTFNKILKNNGSILPGTSRAKGLEYGCDWNIALAETLSGAFHSWYTSHKAETKTVSNALQLHVDGLFRQVLYILNNSNAEITTIERAKKMWKHSQQRLQAKVAILIEKVEEKQQWLLRRATMEDDRQNGLIPSVTRELYDDVYTATPPLNDGSGRTKRKYMTPKLKFQKDRFRELFTDEKDHFMDKTMRAFRSFINETLNIILEKHIGEISSSLERFTEMLRSQVPIPYTINAVGQKIRDDLRELLPELQKKSEEFSKFFPQNIKREEKEIALSAIEDLVPSKPINHNFSCYLNSVKRKRPEPSIRIKQESGTKRSRLH
jgi:hypothetical protein